MKGRKALVRGLVILGIVSLGFLAGCGGGTVVSVAILPPSSVVEQGGTKNFTATITGSSNTAVNWSVQEGATGGSITSAGLYTAPSTAGSFHVVATSQADTTKSATSIVTVPVIGISVQPSTASMTSGESITFTSPVTGSVNTTVVWSVQEPSGGQVSSMGTYTAPAAFGVFHVVATSQADTSKNAIATVTVAAASVSVLPTSDVLGPGGVREFSATVASAIQQAVTWSVQEGAAGGSVTSSGPSAALYTAPNQVGNFHPLATSVADPSKSAMATVAAVAAGFRPTGNMSIQRSAHSATVLQGGKVLIAGGNSCAFSYYYYYYSSKSCPLKSAEIYDPTAGTFSAPVEMSTARDFHTATFLPSGKVLLAGGGGSSAELYDPSSGTFTATGGMNVMRSSHTATLLNTGKVLIVGGDALTGALASAELYDPVTGKFTLTGSLTDARTSHTATLLNNGKVLVVGGSQQTSSLMTAELYDPASGTFSTAGSLGTPRTNHTATLLVTGKVLIAGGSTQGNALANAELYDDTSGSFVATGTMTTTRETHIAILLGDGKVLLAGGSQQDYTAELYNPVTGTFAQTGSMATGRSLGAGALLTDGRVLVTGGSDSSAADVYK
jgi:large repetitive protein